jgi:hypothetical protein
MIAASENLFVRSILHPQIFREASAFTGVPTDVKRVGRLESLQVVAPCTVPWASMEGDDQVRFCGRCRKNVYNVAAMSRGEALAVVERSEGRVCMVLTRRQDGTLVTGDCWAALRRARRRGCWRSWRRCRWWARLRWRRSGFRLGLR